MRNLAIVVAVCSTYTALFVGGVALCVMTKWNDAANEMKKALKKN